MVKHKYLYNVKFCYAYNTKIKILSLEVLHMIHTFELERIITAHEYDSYKKVLSKSSYKSYPTERYMISNYEFNQIDLHLRLSKCVTGYRTIYKLLFCVNPTKIVLGNDSVCVSDINIVLESLKQVDEFFSAISIGLICSDFKVARIDYSIDIRLLSHEQVSYYIDLLKMGAMPKNFVKKGYYSKTGHRYIPYESSLYLARERKHSKSRKKKYLVLNLYDKQQEIIDNVRNNNTKKQFMIRRANEIIRFEVQCFKDKINNIADRFNMANENIYSFLNIEIVSYVLNYYISKICFQGNYYKYRLAVREIENSKYDERIKNDMLLLLRTTFKRKSFDNAVNHLQSNNKYFNFKKILQCFNLINVNPVTIPSNWAVEFLENPLTLINGYIDECQPVC